MALNIGTLIGYLELDDTKFARKADNADRKINALQLHLKALSKENPEISVEVQTQTKALDELKAKLADLKRQSAEGADVRVEAAQALIQMDRVMAKIRDLSKERVEIPIEADTNPIDAKIDALRIRLIALGKMNPKVSVQVNTQTAQLDYLTGKLAYLDAQAAAGVDVRVETEQALLELERVKLAIREIHGKTVKVKADTAEAERKIAGLNGLWTTILGLGPALVPVAGAATLGISAIGAAALSAAGAVGVLKLALAGVGSAVSAYGQYQSALDKAGITRSAALQKATTAAQRQSAQQSYTSAVATAHATLAASSYGQLGPQGQKFARFAGRLLAPGGAVFKLRADAQNAVLPGLTAGIKGAVPALPHVDNAITSIGHAVGGEIASAGKALNDPFFTHFFAFLAREAPKDIRLFGSIFGNVIEGVLRYLQKFAPDGRKLLVWVDDAAKKFNHWTAGKGLTDFIASLHRDLPSVLRVVQPLVKILPGLVSGFNETGVAELSTIGLVLRGISKLPTGVIQFLGTALPLIVLGLKGMTLAQGVAGGIKSLAVMLGLMAPAATAAAAGEAEVDAAMDANPIGLVVLAIAALAAGFIYAYNHSKTFRTIVNAALHGVGVAVKWLFDFIKAHWAILLPILLGPFGLLVVLVVKNFGKIEAAIRVLGKWGIWLWNNVFEPVTKLIIHGVSGVLAIWAGLVGALSKVPGFHWLGGLASALQGASNMANSLANAIGKIPTHKTVTVQVVHVSHGVVHATGGHVPGVQHHAAGGWAWGAGTGASDSIWSKLSNGEFVVNAASAAANAPILEAMNRSHGPLAANGYTTSRRKTSSGPVAFVIENWQDGTGFMRSIASSEDDANHRHLAALSGMQPA